MNLHKMIEICLKDDNMHRFVMINALIFINIYVITCINSMLSKLLKNEWELIKIFIEILKPFTFTSMHVS